MLKSLDGIGAYAFRQYADDPNITVWFEAFNSAAQQYLDWFTGDTGEGVSLAYYPGLSGAVLQWMGAGLYGVPYFSALASPGTAAVGPFNTAALNTIPFNAYTPATETYYAVTDDIYQRIITWNVYKGDGKRFCPRWLKRRIMRFLVGANGIDPQPWNEGFTVGCENTQAISVQFSGQTCTVSINELAISALVQLTPNILPIFAAAFMAPGVLEKPIEWNYVVDITTMLTALVSPTLLSVTGASAAESTGSASVTVLGGSGSYTYAWSWLSGGTGITIGSASAAVTDFSASALTAGETLTGVAKCVVTDTVSHDTTTCSVSVSLTRVTEVSASASPSSIDTVGTADTVTSAQVQVTASGGAAPYTYSWTWGSGGSGIGIDSPNTSATTFTAVGLAENQTDSGTAVCTVTDFYGQQTTVSVPVEISRTTMVTAEISPSSLSVTGASSSESTGTTTVTASGGIAPYSYVWGWQSGGAGITTDSATSNATAFTAASLSPGQTLSGTAVCTVTDSAGQQTQVTCAVEIVRVTTVSASVSPPAQSSSGSATSQTTGISTVTPSGGSGTYTLAWTWSSGGAGIGINSPSSAATSFTASGMTPGDTYSGVALCTVTDAYGQTTQVTVAVSIACQIIYSGTLTAGQVGTPPYFTTGYLSGSFGSLSPTTDVNGNTITALWGDAFSGEQTALTITSSSELGQSYFLAVVIDGSFTLDSSAASYSYSGGVNQWRWVGTTPAFEDGVEYTIELS